MSCFLAEIPLTRKLPMSANRCQSVPMGAKLDKMAYLMNFNHCYLYNFRAIVPKNVKWYRLIPIVMLCGSKYDWHKNWHRLSNDIKRYQTVSKNWHNARCYQLNNPYPYQEWKCPLKSYVCHYVTHFYWHRNWHRADISGQGEDMSGQFADMSSGEDTCQEEVRHWWEEVTLAER